MFFFQYFITELIYNGKLKGYIKAFQYKHARTCKNRNSVCTETSDRGVTYVSVGLKMSAVGLKI